jgi:ribosome modulation factor
MKRRTALEGAYRKGLAACVAGAAPGDCPYADKRKWSGALTWSRAFRNAWRDGFEHAKKNREDALITLSFP